MRVGFLGNCQVQGIALSAQAFAPDIEIVQQALVGLNPADQVATGGVVDQMLGCDVVFVQALEGRRPELAPLISAIMGAHRAAFRFPMLAFRGFHPDCGHLRRDGGQVAGAAGPYHSILACAGWLEGLAAARAAALFNAFSYSALGYFGVYDRARDVLNDQGSALGYDLSSFFGGGSPVFMHTVNHPTAWALHELARQALDLAGLRRSALASPPEDHLAAGPIWPVYPDLARRLALPGAASKVNFSTVALSLVKANYASLQQDLERHGPLDLAETVQPNGGQIKRAQAFIREYVVAS